MASHSEGRLVRGGGGGAGGWFGLVYWGLTPQQQPGSYQGGEIMMKSVFWWRKPEYPEETTDRGRGADINLSATKLSPMLPW